MKVLNVNTNGVKAWLSFNIRQVSDDAHFRLLLSFSNVFLEERFESSISIIFESGADISAADISNSPTHTKTI